MKFGFDYHGVIEKYPKAFYVLIKALRKDGNEVHIITGTTKQEITPILKRLEIEYDYIYSITDALLSGGRYKYKFDDFGRPIFPEGCWNSAKGEYCAVNQIEFYLDDTEEYMPFFSTPVALFKKVKK
jgi:hypothetical protein